MKDYIVKIKAEGGWESDIVPIRATSESEALEEIVDILNGHSGDWVELPDINGDLNVLRVDRIINIIAIEEFPTREN